MKFFGKLWKQWCPGFLGSDLSCFDIYLICLTAYDDDRVTRWNYHKAELLEVFSQNSADSADQIQSNWSSAISFWPCSHCRQFSALKQSNSYCTHFWCYITGAGVFLSNWFFLTLVEVNIWDFTRNTAQHEPGQHWRIEHPAIAWLHCFAKHVLWCWPSIFLFWPKAMQDAGPWNM